MDIWQRPLVMSTHAMVSSGHYLATAAGQRIILEGGNAVDAAAAVCFCLLVLNPHEAGLGGEVPTLIYSARERAVWALSGVGCAPRAFTIDWCRAHGIDLIPGDGYLPACVPAEVGTWALALERFGRLSFSQVLAPAIELAEEGFPMYAQLREVLLAVRGFLLERYPTTAALYLPGGRVPEIGERVHNHDLASVLRRLCQAEAAAAQHGREAGLRAACDAFYRGAVAERIVEFIHTHPVLDASGQPRTGLLEREDLAEWQATLEQPLTLEYRGLTVHKCPAWTQGPVFLQQLALLEGFDLRGMGLNSARYIHTIAECAKLAFADREAYYGDPRFDAAPWEVLLSPEYAARRRALVGEQASLELRPGDAGRGTPDYVSFDVRGGHRRALGLEGPPTEGAGPAPGDTSHLDVVDAEGNMVAATPSGGWLQSSPVIEGLGFPLGTRGQMFYLDPRRPNALAPHKRPRATLTPTLVTERGAGRLAFGMRGGDVQDQKTLQFFLAYAEFGLDPQAAADAAVFHSTAFPSSFYPREGTPGGLVVEARVGPAVIEELRARGHALNVVPYARENVMGIERDERHGVLRGGVASSGEQAYVLGW
jgi:gamma-glutamyltranspeptidase/glutathione hydrolase